MKVAIVTLHRLYNYGSVLQAYATQQVFEKMGCETVIVDYITPERTKIKILFSDGAVPSKGFVKKFIYRFFKLFSIALKEMTFGRFVNKNLKLTKKYITADDLEKHPPNADIYVTGSDQTWNSDYNRGVDRGFFLGFIPDSKIRIAYVASFGKASLDSSEINETVKYLRKYQAISVREDAAVKILEDIGFKNAVQLIDPTLQINKNSWMKLASKRLVKDKYLILMLLYNEDNHATEYARKIANEKNLKLVKISWEMKKPAMVEQLFTHRSPSDFLSLFAYADFVVTNSFHGVAFSINLEKQFIVVPRNEYNSRIDSLLRLTGLKNRNVNSEQGAIIEANNYIDYAPVNEKLDIERKRAIEFIERIIS